MIQIVYQRSKCIGCNYCIELAPDRWAMNKKDGKSVLLESRYKKGFYDKFEKGNIDIDKYLNSLS